jgi:hypothetical protein
VAKPRRPPLLYFFGLPVDFVVKLHNGPAVLPPLLFATTIQ